jgi:CRISPR-associated protein Cas2
MCEVAPGVYTAPRMTAGVRERIWGVLCDWYSPHPDQALVMTWEDRKLPGGQDFRTLGVPRKQLAEAHGIYLARRELSEDEVRSLTTELDAQHDPPTAQ